MNSVFKSGRTDLLACASAVCCCVLQTQILDHWLLWPLQLFCFNFGACLLPVQLIDGWLTLTLLLLLLLVLLVPCCCCRRDAHHPPLRDAAALLPEAAHGLPGRARAQAAGSSTTSQPATASGRMTRRRGR